MAVEQRPAVLLRKRCAQVHNSCTCNIRFETREREDLHRRIRLDYGIVGSLGSLPRRDRLIESYFVVGLGFSHSRMHPHATRKKVQYRGFFNPTCALYFRPFRHLWGGPRQSAPSPPRPHGFTNPRPAVFALLWVVWIASDGPEPPSTLRETVLSFALFACTAACVTSLHARCTVLPV